MVFSFEYLVGVGSNLDDRHGWIERALKLLEESGVEILKRSTLIESAPIGAADKAFINGAIVCRSHLNPQEFMALLLKIEIKLGRVRDVRWGNRNIDLDLLLAKGSDGQEIAIHSEQLTLPHPRMWERDFVMNPAREIWEFSSHDTSWLWLSAVAVAIRWIFAACIPFGNDEAYYWDWGRAPQLSYFDHPPMVSWIAWAGEHLWPFDRPFLAGRLLIPIGHFAATLLLYEITKKLSRRPLTRGQNASFVLVTQFIPAFSLGGIMLMPDIGLILFATCGLYLILSIFRETKLSIGHGLAMGLSFGLAGASKYHAALIAAGSLGYLFWCRRGSILRDFGFWVTTIVVGLATVSPVLIWNAEHQWVSFLFQGSRGFSGGGFAILPALRTLLGELIFLGPAFLAIFYYFRSRIGFKNEIIPFLLWSSLPMLGLLKIFSFTSQTLPHWSMPSFWLMAPIAVLGLAEVKTLRRWVTGYGVILCLIVPLLLSSSALRSYVISLTHNRPGGLGELTLWDTAKQDSEFVTYVFDDRWIDPKWHFTCGGEMKFAAARWFTVAQAAANLPGHPVVETLDPDKLSYYQFRTPPESWKGCPTVLLSEEAHFAGVIEAKRFEAVEHRRFVIEGHEDRAIIVARGRSL